MSNIELRRMSVDDTDVQRMHEINVASFPPEEFIPTEEMFTFGNMDIRVLGIYADGVLAGFFTVIVVPGCVYLCYFAVDELMRGKGIGTAALGKLMEMFSDRQLVVDFEAYDEPDAENVEERIRRRHFYYRNGFMETGMFMYYMQTEFEVAATKSPMDRAAFETILYGIHELVPDDFPGEMYSRSRRQ